MGHELKRDYQKTLSEFKIQPTPVRVSILKMMCEQFEKGFTFFDLLKASKAMDPPVSSAAIVFTIGLLRMRGLVKRIDNKVLIPDKKAGRPDATFICILPPLTEGEAITNSPT